MPSTDPFTLAHNAIWSALTSHAGFTSLVKPGNRVDFSREPYVAIKNNVASNDMPEVSLLPGAFTMSPFGSNSRTADLSQTFQLITATELLSIIPLNRVKYQVFIALLKAGDDLGLTSLCRTWNITDGQDGTGGITMAGMDAERGKRGFASILNVTVQMYQSRAALLAL